MTAVTEQGTPRRTGFRRRRSSETPARVSPSGMRSAVSRSIRSATRARLSCATRLGRVGAGTPDCAQAGSASGGASVGRACAGVMRGRC